MKKLILVKQPCESKKLSALADSKFIFVHFAASVRKLVPLEPLNEREKVWKSQMTYAQTVAYALRLVPKV
jgi:hypothetical protein